MFSPNSHTNAAYPDMRCQSYIIFSIYLKGDRIRAGLFFSFIQEPIKRKYETLMRKKWPCYNLLARYSFQ